MEDNFLNLDIVECCAFGLTGCKSENWLNMLKLAENFSGITSTEIFEKNLAQDVNVSYVHLAQFLIKNLDDDVDYSLKFSNLKKLWQLTICNSPKAEIDVSDKVEFMKSEAVKHAISRAVEIVSVAKSKLDIVMQHVEAGELLDVDENKLDAIVRYYLNDNILMSNFRLRKVERFS